MDSSKDVPIRKEFQREKDQAKRRSSSGFSNWLRPQQDGKTPKRSAAPSLHSPAEIEEEINVKFVDDTLINSRYSNNSKKGDSSKNIHRSPSGSPSRPPMKSLSPQSDEETTTSPSHRSGSQDEIPITTETFPVNLPPLPSPGELRVSPRHPTLQVQPTEVSLIYLNIGGYKYVTTKKTLCQSSNYFASLLNGNFTIHRDADDYIFIDRPGKYFEPILEYLITDEVVVPKGICSKALVREAAFYSIDFPLIETHQSLSFVTDSWLEERFEMRAYLKIAQLADPILACVLEQFRDKANTSAKIETVPFLVEDQTQLHQWLDQTEFGKEYWRFDFIDRQKKVYSKRCIVNDDYFHLLSSEENQKTIISYAKMHHLSIEILPVNIHEPGVVGRLYFTIGYKFRHVKQGGSPRKSSGGSADQLLRKAVVAK